MLSSFADSDVRPRVIKLAVTHLPGSGTPAELLAECGIDRGAIKHAARRLASPGPQRKARDEAVSTTTAGSS